MYERDNWKRFNFEEIRYFSWQIKNLSLPRRGRGQLKHISWWFYNAFQKTAPKLQLLGKKADHDDQTSNKIFVCELKYSDSREHALGSFFGIFEIIFCDFFVIILAVPYKKHLHPRLSPPILEYSWCTAVFCCTENRFLM